MFEGLVRQLLVGYLGRYIKDIQKDQLKIGLWNGNVGDIHADELWVWASGVLAKAPGPVTNQTVKALMGHQQVKLIILTYLTQFAAINDLGKEKQQGKFLSFQHLKIDFLIDHAEEVLLENVELILEAFDYLQLPFALKQGRVGKLSIKIPWKKLGWDPIIIVSEDVFVSACPRDDDEWSSEAVERREFAGKQAKLAAAELGKLSKRILDGIQVSIRNVHVSYSHKKDDSARHQVQFIFGIRFSSLTIMTDSRLNTLLVLSSARKLSGLVPSGREIVGAVGAQVGIRFSEGRERLLMAFVAWVTSSIPTCVAMAQLVLSSSGKFRAGQVNKIVEISGLGIYCITSKEASNSLDIVNVDSSLSCCDSNSRNDISDYILVPFDVTVSLVT
ncbi:hypothetical protein ACLOJK_006355 [Asimina triloba]